MELNSRYVKNQPSWLWESYREIGNRVSILKKKATNNPSEIEHRNSSMKSTWKIQE